MNTILHRGLDFLMPVRGVVRELSISETPRYHNSRSIAARDRVDWADWLSRFEYMDIQHDRIFIPAYFGNKKNLDLNYPELASIIITKQTISLDDVFGLSASKSNLSKFSDISTMAKACCPELLEQSLDSLLNWPELSIFGDNSNDIMSVYAWDKRKFLLQSGGSHHFAAACYRSKYMGETRYIEFNVHEIKLNQIAINKLLSDVTLLHSANDIETGKIMDALHKENIPFAIYESPYWATQRGGQGATFVISRAKVRYQKASKLLATKLENLGQKLQQLIDLQN